MILRSSNNLVSQRHGPRPHIYQLFSVPLFRSLFRQIDCQLVPLYLALRLVAADIFILLTWGEVHLSQNRSILLRQ
jgi:hypothetical protein